MKWSDVFHRSQLGPAIFVTAASHQGRVVDWAKEKQSAHAAGGGLFDSGRNAWAILEGGVHVNSHYGFGGLRDGVRVIGWGPLHLALSDLGLTPPRSALIGEQVATSLRTMSAARPTLTNEGMDAHGRARLLAAAYDGPTLQWATRLLIGDHGLPAKRSTRAPASGIWGDFGFTHGAAQLLHNDLAPEAAVVLARELEEPSWPFNVLTGFGESDAETILAAHAAGPDVLSEWAAVGMPANLAASWLRQGRDLAAAREFIERGGLS